MMTMKELKQKQQAEFDAFPLGFAFNKEQFQQMMEKWGLSVNDTDKIFSIGGGGYVRKQDAEALIAMSKRHKEERKILRKELKAAKLIAGIQAEMMRAENF